MLKITIVSGTKRLGRKTPKVGAYLEKLFKEHPEVQEVNLLDVATYDFPVMEERRGRLDNPPAGLDEFGEALDRADAIVFISPEYNGSYAGAFKNTIDYFRKEFERKPIGVVTVSDGRLGGVNASHDLQKLILALGGYAMPKKLMVSNVGRVFDDNGEVVDKKKKKSAPAFAAELLWLATAIQHHKELV